MNAEGFSTERNSVMAINALTLSVFTGSQILSRLTTGSLGIQEILLGFVAFVVLSTILIAAQNSPNTYAAHDAGIRSWLARFLTNAPRVKKPTLLLASIVFALIPHLEAGRLNGFGMASRLMLGAAVIAVVADQADRWLLGVAALTIVLHPWNHPTTVTVVFVGLIMLGIALRTRADIESPLSPAERHQSTAGSGLAGAPSAMNPVSAGEHPGGSLRPTPSRGFRSTSQIVGAIVLSLLTATLLRDQARQLAWTPNGSSRSGGGLGGTDDQSIPRERFRALNADSQLDLAYKPTRSTQEIMTLFTNQPTPAFLRAQTFDQWTGKTWKAGGSTTDEVPVQAGIWLVRPSFQDELAEFIAQRRNRNSVTEPPVGPDGVRQMVIQAKVLFNGYTPVPIEPVAMAADTDRPTSRWQSDGTIVSDGAGPNVYVVVNVPSRATAFEMSRTDLLDTSNISAKTKALANEIVTGLSSNEAKAQAISAWVTANIRYDLSVEAPNAGADPIDELLFRAKAGSCTHFATATAALLRAVGIPARVATGFVGQTLVAPNQISVQAKDAHAWAEIPLAGGGWKVTDTTLGATEVTPTPTKLPSRGVLGVMAALIVIIAVFAFRHRRRLRSEQSADAQIWDELLAVGRVIDLRPAVPVSYRGYAEELDETLSMGGELARVGASLDRRAFGPRSPGATAAEPETGAARSVLVVARTRAKAERDKRRSDLRELRRTRRRRYRG